MAQPKIDWPSLDSLLRFFPEYVNEIGMIVIEITSLEVMLSDLLSVLLSFNDDLGHQIYFSSKAAIARLDTITNVIEYKRFDAYPDLRATVLSVVKRSKAVMGKRHDIIHALWTPWADGSVAGQLRPPFESTDEGDQIKLEVLKKVVADIRSLIRDTRHAMDEACFSLPFYASPHIRAELERRAEQLRQDNLHLEARFQAQQGQPLTFRAEDSPLCQVCGFRHS